MTTSVLALAAARPNMRTRAELRRVWREHRILILALSVYAGVTVFIGPLVGYRLRQPLLLYFVGALALLAGAIPFVLTFWTFAERERLAAALPPLDGWRIGWASVRRRLFTLERILGVALVTIFMALVMAIVAGWRTSIPFIHPYAYDVQLAAIDRWLHGGVDPWRWTHMVFGSELATRLLGYSYGFVWGAAKVGIVMALAFSGPSWMRRRVLLAYLLEYALLGSLLANLVSAAGPVYYAGIVGGPDPFAPLVEKLNSIHANGGFLVVEFQQRLWAEYSTGAGFGITAFPSIHVSSAALLGLAGTQLNRWLGLAGWMLCAITVITSVHLGWHYAIDGYASIVGMLGIWWLAGRLTAPTSAAQRAH